MSQRTISKAEKISYFESNLQVCKPALFDVANQIVTALPDRQWDVIVGDDKGGRLPTRFIRKVIQGSGAADPSTAYITAGRKARDATSQDTFEAYAAKIGNLGTKALIVSESNNTHATAKFICGLLKTHFEEVDYAVIVSRDDCSEIANRTFVGGYDNDLVNAVYDTFENPLLYVPKAKSAYLGFRRMIGRSLPKNFKNKLLTTTGIHYDPDSSILTGLAENPGFAYASGVVSNDRDVSNYCYSRMDDLANEHLATTAAARVNDLAA